MSLVQEKPTKIAVLGGGMASLACVFELTADPNWKSKFEITVYQLGFRLGGKGASGRNMEIGERIEEHGPHSLWGFYDNTSRIIVQCYDEMIANGLRTTDDPLSTFETAFFPGADLALGVPNATNDRFIPRFLSLPKNGARPGIDTRYRLGDFLMMAFGWLAWPIGGLIRGLRNPRRLPDMISHAWEICLFFIYTAKGVIRDIGKVSRQGWEVLDDEDFREWLKRHGAPERVLNSGLVRYPYFIMSYDVKVPAGTVLKGIIRSVLHYRGRYVWQLAAGMGEVVFVPLYLVLKNRGVKFRYFHRVDNLSIGTDEAGRKHVEAVRLARQITLRGDEYQPLTTTSKGILCWPVKPLWKSDGITQFEHLEDYKNYEFESYDRIPGEVPINLRIGNDFDLIVLAISVGGLQHCCGELIADNGRFREMINQLNTVATAGAQFWLSKDLKELGWQHDAFSMYIGHGPYKEVAGDHLFDTYSDFSSSIVTEAWTVPAGHCCYVCGIANDQLDPRSQLALLVRSHLRDVLPELYHDGDVRWEWFVDTRESEGESRLDAQYVTWNKNPSDRYVRGVAGTTKFRLEPNESGYENLVLAGDWVRTRLNMGSLESATMAGLQAAVVVSNMVHGSCEDQYARIVGAFRTRSRWTKMS